MDSLGVIANPYSRSLKSDPSLSQKLSSLLAGSMSTLIVTQDFEHLAKALQMFKSQKIQTIAVLGGDGTIAQTLTALKQIYGSEPIPQVLVLGGGTMNVIKLNLQIKGTPYKILRQFLIQASRGDPLKTTKAQTLTDGTNYGFLFGCGVVATYLEKFYQKKTGPIGALGLTLKFVGLYLFSRSKYYEIFGENLLRLSADQDVPLPLEDRCAVMASTLERMPLGPKFFPFARFMSSKFQYFYLNYGSGHLPLRLISLFLFSGLGSKFGRTSGLASTLLIERGFSTDVTTKSQGSREQPHPPTQDLLYTIDGEIFNAKNGKLKISIGFDVSFVLLR